MNPNSMSGIRRLRDDRRGQAFVLVGVSLVALFALTGFGIDVANTLQIRRELQASTDAAALAGALLLPDTNRAIATAKAYSSISGGKNIRSNHPTVTMATGYPLTKCLTSTSVPCSPANAIVVKQQTGVPTFFARVIGWNSLTVTATATASAKGGIPKPLDVMLVLDTTASMNSSCSSPVAGVSNPTRRECAKAGARALLNGLWPCIQGASCGAAVGGHVAHPVDEAGLMVFPGLKSSSVAKDFDCSNNMTSSDVVPYQNSPSYLVNSLASDFRTSDTSSLNGGNSTLVKAVDWTDGNTCTSGAYGVESPGGVGTYFADAISQAQSVLNANGRTNVQKAIIVLSDGDSNYTGVSNPCHRAITAAQSAAAQGTWVYSIAYGASTSAGSSCTYDSPAISAHSTMQQLASDPTKFYNQPLPGDLTTIFKQIVIDLTSTRLVSDNTP
jgi:hypothetical protein